MPGLHHAVLDNLDRDLALQRIRTDVASDFILAPHYSAVFVHAGDALWDQLNRDLKSGDFEPRLPISIEVPKRSGVTRPASILEPADRVIYQALVDYLIDCTEPQIDRNRVFSHQVQSPDPDGLMFQPAHQSWEQLQSSIHRLCEDFDFAIKADVASYFDRLYQHNLINLLHSSGCEGGAVNLLEKLLSAWMQKDSHGIIVGVFPSDYLGTFCLCGVDAEFNIEDIPSARYVDDIYLFFESETDAQRGMVILSRMLRKEGLHLNEQKTSILTTDQLILEETHIDRLFSEARREVDAELEDFAADWYGFPVTWMPYEEEDEREEEDIETRAVEALYDQVGEKGIPTDKIERFCLPVLAASGSTVAIERALSGIAERPHLAQLYSAYLVRAGRDSRQVQEGLEHLLVERDLPYSWQLMWVLAALVSLHAPLERSVAEAIRILQQTTYPEAVRGLCAFLIAREGTPAQRRILRRWYEDEPSAYVRSALLYASRYFPTPERRTCIRAWGGHSSVNSLVARAVRQITQQNA